MKKAMELALLCNVEVLLVIHDNKTRKSLRYSSCTDYHLLLQKVENDQKAKVYTSEDVSGKFIELVRV